MATTANGLLSSHAALLVAFVTGAFSLFGLIIAKENKVSEFRQEWIDGLRNDMADFVSQTTLSFLDRYEYAIKGVSDTTYVQYLSQTREALRESIRASTKIKLKLHSEKRESLELTKTMGKLMRLSETIPTDFGPFREEIGSLIMTAEIEMERVLASEWARVRRGELVFRIAKYAAVAVFLLSFALLVGFWVSARR